MNKSTFPFPLFIGAVILVSVIFSGSFQKLLSPFHSMLSSVFFTDSVTEEGLRKEFALAKRGEEKLRILIVPGHDDQAWGTDYHGVKEAELTTRLGKELFDLFAKDSNFEPILSRTENGYNPALTKYFTEEKDSIQEFIKTQKGIMNEYLSSGEVVSNRVIKRNPAPSSVVHRLYGINKWANENEIDIAIHIHFNDYPRENRARPGAYSGFSIYIPEKQYSNAKGSRVIAKSIFDKLGEKYSVSNLPLEKAGLIEDQRLIALGSFNTLDGVSVLIEYGYIYEPHLQGDENLKKHIPVMALETYLGVLDFFEKPEDEYLVRGRAPSAILKYDFTHPIFKKSSIRPIKSSPVSSTDLGPSELYKNLLKNVRVLEGF